MRNLLKLLQIKSKESFQTLRSVVDRQSWGTSFPTIVNAFYSPPRNHISTKIKIRQALSNNQHMFNFQIFQLQFYKRRSFIKMHRSKFSKEKKNSVYFPFSLQIFELWR